MNTIIIELCAEDRARLDNIAKLLEQHTAGTPTPTPAPAAEPEAPQDPTPEIVTQEVETVTETPAAEPEPTKAEKPKATHADVMAVLQPMLAPGSKKRATARDIVLAYAPKVSAIPADKLDEVLARLNVLAADDM